MDILIIAAIFSGGFAWLMAKELNNKIREFKSKEKLSILSWIKTILMASLGLISSSILTFGILVYTMDKKPEIGIYSNADFIFLSIGLWIFLMVREHFSHKQEVEI